MMTCVVLMACMALSYEATSQSMSKLEGGAIDVRFTDVAGSDTPRTHIKAVLNAPPSTVWKIVGDCANYENTFNRVASSRLIKQKGSTHICEIIIDMPFPFSNLTAVTTAEHQEGPKEWSRRWKLVRGDYVVNSGSWVLKPHGDGMTYVEYTLHAEPTTAIPDWVRIKAQKSSFPDMFERLRREVAAVK